MKKRVRAQLAVGTAALLTTTALAAEDLSAGGSAKVDFPKPYSPPCVERENVFEFTEKPRVKDLGNDKYEITFAVKGNCDVTVGIVDQEGKVVRHLGAGVLGPNAPLPFQKNSLKQTIYWNGKDDLDEYHKTPEKLKVRVMLGLKPEFDKRIGGTSPYNLLAGIPVAIAATEDGVCVWSRGKIQIKVRKFDHEGKYIQSLVPPPTSLPEEKLKGMGYVEYEPGKRTVQGPLSYETIAHYGCWLPADGPGLESVMRVAVANNRMYYLNPTFKKSAGDQSKNDALIHFFGTDGSTEVKGMAGQIFLPGQSHPGLLNSRLAASPDGRWLYMVGAAGAYGGCYCAVVRGPVDGSSPAKAFIGKDAEKNSGHPDRIAPGNEAGAFNCATDVDCDTAGRIYVADSLNNRVQIFSPEGKYLKEIAMDRPALLGIHRKTGAIYVQHKASVQGRSVARLTKFISFDQLQEEFHVDGIDTTLMEVDSWAEKPRLWLAGNNSAQCLGYVTGDGPSVSVWEENGKNLKKILDFDEEARKEAGENYLGRWSGGYYDKVACDAFRGHLYYLRTSNLGVGEVKVIDLKTGRFLRTVKLRGPMDDVAFDKRGYLHCHFNPGEGLCNGVSRLDPSQIQPWKTVVGPSPDPKRKEYAECPYDYGVDGEYVTKGWQGVLPTRSQHKFSNGLGVTMMGDVAVVSSIYSAPRMDDLNDLYYNTLRRLHPGEGYGGFVRNLQEMEKRGLEKYTIPRRPGYANTGETIWTYDRSGELRQESVVIAPFLMGGVQMDEDGFIYFTHASAKMVNGKTFLLGRGGNFGCDKPFVQIQGIPRNDNPLTGTYIKAKPKDVRFLFKNAALPLDDDTSPKRPPDAVSSGTAGWWEGVEWMYAGASPVQQAYTSDCQCPSMRSHLDWYKRSFVPEAYRHSIGVLDTNGNLIMHLGRYGNFDDAARMKPGGEDVALIMPRFISGTDDYLVFDDWGERLVVLKLNYHAEETVGIGEVMSAK